MALGGLYLTDTLAIRTKYRIPNLSFISIGVRGFTKFNADVNPENATPTPAPTPLPMATAIGTATTVLLKSGIAWERVNAQNVVGSISGTDADVLKAKTGNTLVIDGYFDSMAVTPDLAPGAQYSILETRYWGEAQVYARALMESRQGALWATPATSAGALWALARYAAQENERLAGEPSLVLNDRSVQTTGQPDNPGSISIVLSGGALHPGTNWLKLQAPTTGQSLYYSLTLRATR